MLLVVIYHSLALWLPNGWFIPPEHTSPILGTVALWINTFQVYGFVLVSGYIFAYLKFEKEKYRELKSFFINKAKRLLVPYVFTMILWVAPWHWFYFPSTIEDFIYRYVLGCSPSQLWFLLMLFFVFLIAYFLSDMIKKSPFWGIVISLLLYGIGIIGQVSVGNYFQIFTACTYFIFFSVGLLLRIYGDEILNRIPVIAYITVDVILFVVYNICDSRYTIIFKALKLCSLLLLHLVGALMAFMLFSRMEKSIDQRTKGDYKNARFYRFLNQQNFTIYLFHQQVIYGVITLLNGKTPSVILAIANFVISLAVSSIIAALLSKWKISRILIGQKM